MDEQNRDEDISSAGRAEDLLIADLIETTTNGDRREWTIGELARECGVTLRALRFYEGKGLLSPRRDRATRLYGAEDRRRLALVLGGKRIGLSLVEIRELLELLGLQGPQRRRRQLRGRLQRQVGVLEDQQREVESSLVAIRRELAQLDARIGD